MLKKIYDFIVSCDDSVFSEQTFLGGLANIWMFFMFVNLAFFSILLIVCVYVGIVSVLFGV